MHNEVTLIGHLGDDPETYTAVNGNTRCTFSLATTRKWTGRDGEKGEETSWHDVVIWGKLGDIAAKYLRKGSKVFLKGRIDYYKKIYDERTVKKCNVLVTELVMLDRRPTDSPTPRQQSKAAALADDVMDQPQYRENWDKKKGALVANDGNDDLPF